MYGRCSGAMPLPVSRTAMPASSGAVTGSRVTEPPDGVAWRAFVTRLPRIVWTWAWSPTAGRSPSGPVSSMPRMWASMPRRATHSRADAARSTGPELTFGSRSSQVSSCSSRTSSRRRTASARMNSADSARSSGVEAVPSLSAVAKPSIAVTGVRSSWATSARNSRWRWSAASSRSVMRLNDWPRRPSSSSLSRTRTSKRPRVTASALSARSLTERRRRLATPLDSAQTRAPAIAMPPMTSDEITQSETAALGSGRSRMTSTSPLVAVARASRCADRVAPVHDLALHQHHQVGVADEALRVAGAAGRAGDAAAVDLLGDGGRLLLERDLDLGARPALHDPAEAQHDQRHDRQRHQDRQGDAGADRPRLQPAQDRPHAAGSSL